MSAHLDFNPLDVVIEIFNERHPEAHGGPSAVHRLGGRKG
jgi:hypothetical protein